MTSLAETLGAEFERVKRRKALEAQYQQAANTQDDDDSTYEQERKKRKRAVLIKAGVFEDE